MTEHLVVLPDRDTAEQVAADLVEEGFTDARVVRMPLAGEDDSDADEWGVHVVEDTVADPTGPVAHGLRDRFRALAEEHDGWYDDHP